MAVETRFSPREEKAALLMGNLIGGQPETVIWFLEGWGIEPPEEASEKMLAGLLLQGIAEKRAEFRQQLAEMLVWGWDEDAFLGGEQAPELNLGADPVSAIAGAVGSIANLIGQKGRRKANAEQARTDLLGQILERRNAPIIPQSPPRRKSGASALLICGIVFATCLGALFLFSQL